MEDYNTALDDRYIRMVDIFYLGKKLTPAPRYKPIMYKDTRFQCYRELTEHFELDYDLLMVRVRGGWRIEDIVESSYVVVKRGVIYKGKYYSSLDELVEEHTVKENL